MKNKFDFKIESESNLEEAQAKYLNEEDAIKEAEKKKCIIAFY